MKQSNLPNLVANTCDGLTDGAQKLYLDLLDAYQGWSSRDAEKRAFFEADKYDREVGRVISRIMDRHTADYPAGKWKTDLQKFLADRYRNNFLEAKAGHG